MHPHPRIHFLYQLRRNPVLKGAVNLFMGNLYDHIRIPRHYHFFHARGRSSRISLISTLSSIGYLTPLIS